MTLGMTSLQEFIHFRMRELANKAKGLQHDLYKIEAEQEQLRAAALAAGLHLEPAPVSQETKVSGTVDPTSEDFSLLTGRTRRSIPNKTIKEAVLDVLTDAGRGLTALELLDAINMRFDAQYPRTSLSPQLSRLKAEGKLQLDGMIWSLAEPGSEKTEAADDDLGEGTSAASNHSDLF